MNTNIDTFSEEINTFVSKVWNPNAARILKLALPNIGRFSPIVERFTSLLQICQVFNFKFRRCFSRDSAGLCGGSASFEGLSLRFRWVWEWFAGVSGIFQESCEIQIGFKAFERFQ